MKTYILGLSFMILTMFILIPNVCTGESETKSDCRYIDNNGNTDLNRCPDIVDSKSSERRLSTGKYNEKAESNYSSEGSSSHLSPLFKIGRVVFYWSSEEHGSCYIAGDPFVRGADVNYRNECVYAGVRVVSIGN
ncbi:MAG: hypothetical protein HQK91_14140 [Nitrospirae bacterium]|nr:hypothetical protein [Nitrospirota bacterium]